MASPRFMHYRKPVLGLSAVALLFFASLQVLNWREYAARVSWYQVLDKAFGLTAHQYQDWGAICNTLEKWNCSQYVFTQALKDNPLDRGSLANLGMAWAKQGQWPKAQEVFAKYFEYGGSAFDVMFWYAKSWVQTKQENQALTWYYRALAKRPGETEIALELVKHLASMGQLDEALSVVGSFTNGTPDKQPLWIGQIQNLQNLGFADDRQKPNPAFRLPALIGRSHYLAVPKLTPDRSFQYFVVDPESPYSALPKDMWLQMAKHREPASQKPLEVGQRVAISGLNIGSRVLDNVDFVICQACRPRLGKNALEQFSVETFVEDQMEFLVVTEK